MREGHTHKMAARGNDALEDLQQEVMCPLCLDTFEDPRVLLCQHVYCKGCLEDLVSRTRGAPFTIICPECRNPTDISEGGVDGLRVAFKINRLIQLVNKMKLEERPSAETIAADGPEVAVTPPVHGDNSSCKRHPSQALDVYCRRCDEVVCRDCILFGEHAGHQYDKLGEVVVEHRQDVSRKLGLLLKKQPSIQKVAADVKNARHCAEESRRVMYTKIADSYDRIMSVVEQKKQSQLKQFCSNADSRMEDFETREKSLTSMLLEVSAVQRFVERGLKNLGNVDFMARKKGMIMKLDQMNSRINKISLEKQEIDLSPQVVDAKSVEEAELLCDRFLRPYRTVDPLQCSAEAISGNGLIVGETATANIFLKDSEGDACHMQQCVTVELCADKFGEKLSAKVMVQSPSLYVATFTPNLRTRGQCKLLVNVNGCLIGNKSIAVFIECPPHMLGEPLCFINDIIRPGCLKVAQNHMFIRTSSGVCTLDLSNTSKPLVPTNMFPSNGKIQSWWPSEMALDDTFLFISDPKNAMVHKFAIGGGFLTSTTSRLQTPNGLCLAPDGAVYVCDSDGHCIHVFNPDLTLRLTFGSHGSDPGQFFWPDNIAFDSRGQFYVTDYSNNRIQCFTSDHNPKWCAGGKGNRPCDLNEPNVMQIFGTNIFLTDLGGVAVFNTSGQFVTRFAGMCAADASKSSADGIAVDHDGFVYVSDTPRNRIIVF